MQCVYLWYMDDPEAEPTAAWIGPEGLSLDQETWLNEIGAPLPDQEDYMRRHRWLRERGLTGYGMDNAYAAWVESHPGVVPVLIKSI